MPLTSKGEKIKENMEAEYGKEKGEEVFYASKNKGTITGVDAYRGDKEYEGPEQLLGLHGGLSGGLGTVMAPKLGGHRKAGLSGMDAICGRGDKE